MNNKHCECMRMTRDEYKAIIYNLTDGLVDVDFADNHISHVVSEKAREEDRSFNKLINIAIADYLSRDVISIHYNDDTVWICYENDPALMPESEQTFIGNVIDIFEEFLHKRSIILPNSEKDDSIANGEDPRSVANIYGTDYGELQSNLEAILRSWNLI